jgi:hypothetical protein
VKKEPVWMTPESQVMSVKSAKNQTLACTKRLRGRLL